MNYLKFNYKLWSDYWLQKKKAKVEKHSVKTFYKALDIAIAKCKYHPRKYYIVKKNEAEWEILGSQELKNMRKFSVAKSDKTFMDLHELAPYVSPENIKRHIHEQKRRKWYWKWWNMLTENYYKPVTKDELKTLKKVMKYSELVAPHDKCKVYIDNNVLMSFYEFIKKHS